MAQKNFLLYGNAKPSLLTRLKALPALLSNQTLFQTFQQNQYARYGFGFTIDPWNKNRAIQKGYDLNALVYAIIKKIAKTASYAPWGAYRVVDDQQYKRYKSLSLMGGESLTATRVAKVKALEPVKDSRLTELLTYPNPEQTFSEFIENLIGYRLITGDAYMWANMGEIGGNAGKPLELHVLPSQFMNIVTEPGFPVGVLGYMLQDGSKRGFTADEVMHSKYWNPNYDVIGSHLYGFSPLQAAWLTVQQDNDAKQAAIEILQNRGPRGVLAMESLADQPDQVAAEQSGRLKQRWEETRREYRGGIVPIGGKAEWISVGLSINDMKILEIGDYTRETLCNVYGVSSILFNNDAASTLDNYKMAVKEFITNAVLTEANSIRDDLNRKLSTVWGYRGSGIIVDYDASVYSELNEDVGKLVAWLAQAYWLTPNQRLQFQGETVSDDPLMDKYYFPNNLVPLEDLTMGQDIPLPPANDL